jgi:hypothetical protein
MHPQPYPTRPHARAGSAPAGRHLDRVLSDLRLAADHGAQHILAVIVGLITGVLLIESYGAMVTAARAGGRPSPSCGRWAPRLWRWPWRCRCWRPSAWGIGPCCGCRGCCCAPRSRPVHLLQVAVAPPTLVGYLTAGATPVWLLGSFAVLSLLYRTPAPADPAAEVEDEEPAGEEAEQARARPPGLRRPGRRRPARHRRLAGRGRRDQRQLRPRPAGRVPSRPHPRRPWQRAAARHGGGGAVTATIWRTCPAAGPASSSLMTRAASASTARGPASRPPTAPANAPAPASTPGARTGAPSARSSATSAPGPSGSAPTSARTGRISSTAGVGRRQEATTATGPAPPASR